MNTTLVSFFYSKDHLGSTSEMTNSSGTVYAQYGFDPYGVKSVIFEATPADFQYAGYFMHARSGLNLTATRAYNAGLARFISRDPIEEEGGLNLFAYVENDPIRFSDPSGLLRFGPVLLVLDPEQPVGSGKCHAQKPKKPSYDADCKRCVGTPMTTDPDTGKALPPDPEGAKPQGVKDSIFNIMY